MMDNLSFEEAEPLIDKLLENKRYSWRLKSIVWFDFDDLKQKIKSHIYLKWNQRDPSRPIEGWISTIIKNQLINEVRNNFKNYARPCLNKCPFYLGGDDCASCKNGVQGSDCLAYFIWEKTRQRAYNVKIPLVMENHIREINYEEDNFIDIEKIAEKIHDKMKDILTPKQYIIYKMLYIDKFDEERVAKRLKFKTSEKNRRPGYKQIKNIKNEFVKLVKKIIREEDLI